MKKIIEILFRLLSKDYEMDANTREVCRYGLDIFLYTLVSTLGLLAIGAIFRRMIGSIIYIILFYINQTFGGGYHATSHGRCFLAMALPLTLCIFLSYTRFPQWFLTLILVIAGTTLFIFPLRLHKNKKHLAIYTNLLVFRYRCILTIEVLLGFVLIHLYGSTLITTMYVLSAIVSAISRVIGILQDRHAKSNGSFLGCE